MCKHSPDYSDTTLLTIRGKVRNIDNCIEPLVRALNENGFSTDASCCGHGHRPGNIMLSDGRELIIARNHKEGRLIDKLFPKDIHGNPWGEGKDEIEEEKEKQ